MATNRIKHPGYRDRVTLTHPTAVSSGQPCRLLARTGVALEDEGESVASETVVDFGPGVWDLSVKGVDDDGNSAVAVGDPLYYADADVGSGTGFLSKKRSGLYFGVAMEAVTSGSTDTVHVFHDPGSSATQPGDLMLYEIAVGTTAGDTDLTIPHPIKVVDAWAVHTDANGGASDTLTVKSTAAAITDALDWSGGDKALVRAGEIDDANDSIAAAGILRVTTADGGTDGVGAGIVYVLAVRE